MKKLLLIVAMACVGCVSQTIEPPEVVCCSAKKSATADKAAVDMFNGKDLTGWENPYAWGKVDLVGDEIHLSTVKKKFFLCTTKKYKDFGFITEKILKFGAINLLN